ncbi:glycine/D-amino acid oxidase-like deaminating enzyme [Dongia mobilis]|uniref:Glycine/D-amino acid oxidase-like deaminating enzyme n=2 Tax=Dongia mobilis TaxID=578943 RepID=A0A4R6WWX0_9PROT|nr:glycine/D-amino acid oxidase-like deaminating enzyme [Dongia mobilis]
MARETRPMPTRRAGRSPWLREALALDETDAPILAGEARCDICIVGGGLAGLWTAIELKHRAPQTSIVIIEADICGGGASGRNSGMVLSQWAKFAALTKFCGMEGAIRLAQAFGRSPAEIAAFCATHGIDAEYHPDGWIWGASCAAHLGSWAGILETLAAANRFPFREVTRDEIAALTGTDAFLAGIHDPTAGTIHPGKLVRGLRRVALGLGVVIHENTPMTRLLRRPQPGVVTPRGMVRAERVILTLNAWSLAVPELRSAILVIASDDAVTAPVPERLAQAGYRRKPLISDSQTFVTGYRTTGDDRLNAGVTGGRLGFGSFRSQRFEGRSAREAAIRAAIARGHPQLADIPLAESWYGPIDRTRSGLPLFGRLPGCSDIFYGYGFSGNGIATTPIGGRILASLALDVVDEWSGCGLVRPPEGWLPPEPIRYFGAHLVRAAIDRADRLAHLDRRPDFLTRRLVALAPGGITTSDAT